MSNIVSRHWYFYLTCIIGNIERASVKHIFVGSEIFFQLESLTIISVRVIKTYSFDTRYYRYIFFHYSCSLFFCYYVSVTVL